MRILLVRVGADQSPGGGSWNAPVDSSTNQFVYVAIPESRAVRHGMERRYSAIAPILASFGVDLPQRLLNLCMHLDPDFEHLTYGDQGERAKQLSSKLKNGDSIVFYSGFRDVCDSSRLVYAIIGILVVDRIARARDIGEESWDKNAHTRRILQDDAEDIVVHGQPNQSGRLSSCIPIGEWRNRAYRVRSDILSCWGGLSVKDGYLQRSARLPEFVNPERFREWLKRQQPQLIQANN